MNSEVRDAIIADRLNSSAAAVCRTSNGGS